MSEQSRHKMFDFEVTPPPAAWETIAARLEDDTKYTALTSKMNQYQETPPAASWEVISSRIQDDGQYASLAAKMNNFDVAPPANVWQHISTSLNETKEEKRPVVSNSSLFYRIAAAAIVAGIVIGAWILFTKQPDHTLVKNNPVIPSSPVPAKIQTTPAVTNPSAQQPGYAVVPHTPRSNRSGNVVRAIPRSDDHPLKYAVVNSIPAYRNSRIVIPSLPILDKNGIAIRDLDVLTTNSNYLVVMGPNGQTTRISSKFASVIRYLNGSNDNNDAEEYLDKVIKESDMWKKRFQEWRNKISQSSFIPSSANFFDIMEFKELIQEKQ